MSNKTVNDNIKIGVTLLGNGGYQRRGGLIRNIVRVTIWEQMEEEIIQITRRLGAEVSRT